ncbi:CBS domain-containing protein [Pelagibacterium limicola]|uniref:CBS domain-containing protein n=1 Tax=Pelagibacterium limicola TaxID=2791022 RepID=UPI0018AFAC3D|nr:CBS domain-containing protein [Pelagibacterium limicola]
MSAPQTIADYMVTELVSLPIDLEINRAVALLLDKRIPGAPVVDETGNLTGILTKKDCFKAALSASYYKQWGGTVGRYMTREVQTLAAGTDIVSAAEAFLASPYRLFPVMENGRLVGVLSRSDLLHAFRDIA